jgi:hypothetical protein
MDLHSGLIIDFELLQKGVIKGELEKAACQKLLNKLITQEHCNIELFLSDRHKGVRFFLKTHYPNVQHEFDVWHLSKSLMKKLKSLDKRKYPEIEAWKTSINNHL